METSVPVTPMATPMLAFFSAGASFTPSPVTATTSPLSSRMVTILSLWAGSTLLKTMESLPKSISFSLSSLISSRSTPV